MKGTSEYNYCDFTRSETRAKSSEFMQRLRVGERAPDVELLSPEGERIRLSHFFGRKHVLLEFGSIT